ncbi:hypothetical protein [Nocardia gamkensis]|uniref:Uncharacterized protein n=1 Tax=Nocardia gamkensis TaxID=352869 RepID=A0A7X6L4N4_9NOCA|nr:hypothetical protein [Nocardia gamkensis]NKY27781.1 hypothetical protein [Nocardia gamkensis]NQE67422.1 hypothetical protein [Nocardia gamkensis]
MELGRRWALETLGEYGPRIREEIAEMVRAEHVASVDAQEASGHRSQSVYGEFWRGILERFEQLGELPGVVLVRPGQAPYKIPVVNGVALFPWRFGKSATDEPEGVLFGTSDARIAAANLKPVAEQGVLDFDLPDPGLTAEEREFFKTLQDVVKLPAVTTGRLVVVAISSSVRGLHLVQWGEVTLTDDGNILWTGARESLMKVSYSRPASTAPTGDFTTGAVPQKLKPAEPDAVNSENDERR